MNILVTGGAGFIGSNITDALVERGHRTAVVDNLSTGKRQHLNEAAEFFALDVADPRLSEVFADFKPEIIIHHAAQIDVRSSILHPSADASVNIMGTIRLLELCREFGVRKMIYASSAAVYGAPEFLGITEEHPIKPQSCYGISKHTAEHYLDVFAQLYDFDYTVLRYANVYGMRQDPKGEGGVVSIFMDRLLEGKQPIIFGSGEQTRDFIFVKDIVSANLAALDKGSRAIVNIGTDTQVSVNELLAIMSGMFGRQAEPEHQPGRPGDIEHSRLSCALAAEKLGWTPTYTLRQGLEETCDYYRRR